MLISYDLNAYLLTTSYVNIKLSDQSNPTSVPSIYTLLDIPLDVDLPDKNKAYMYIFLGMRICIHIYMYTFIIRFCIHTISTESFQT